MNDRGKWIVGFIITLTLALIAGGACILSRMDASFLRKQISLLKAELGRNQDELQQQLDQQEALQQHIADLKDKLQNAHEALDGMEQELRAQKERLGMDFHEAVARERRENQELRNINDQQREGIFAPADDRPWTFSLEKLKEQNPERYQQLMAAREERRQRNLQMQERRTQLLEEMMQRDDLTPQQRANVTRYRELEEQFAQFRTNAQNFSPEERRKIIQDYEQSYREMVQLGKSISNDLFNHAVAQQNPAKAKEAMQLFNRQGQREWRKNRSAQRRTTGGNAQD